MDNGTNPTQEEIEAAIIKAIGEASKICAQDPGAPVEFVKPARPMVRVLSNDSQQNVAKLRASFGLPHSFIVPRLDKKGRPVK